MSTDNHVIDAIDTALRDFSVGPDAMRSAPAAPAQPLADFGVTFRAAAEAFAEALARVAQHVAKTVRQVRPIIEHARAAANDPVHVAGLEARYYVRAAMDPAYAAVEDVDLLVRDLLAGREGESPLLTPQNRRLVAVAAMRGYVTHRLPTEAATAALATTRGSR